MSGEPYNGGKGVIDMKKDPQKRYVLLLVTFIVACFILLTLSEEVAKL